MCKGKHKHKKTAIESVLGAIQGMVFNGQEGKQRETLAKVRYGSVRKIMVVSSTVGGTEDGKKGNKICYSIEYERCREESRFVGLGVEQNEATACSNGGAKKSQVCRD